MASRVRFAPIGVLMCLIAVIAGMIMGAWPAFACTAVYVGKDASADGTTIIAKSNDYQAVWPNYVEVTERVENETGRTMPIDDEYPLCFDPGQKVSLQDVMQIIRNRFEGTEYAPDETRRTDMRVIGTDTALSVHIAQIYPDLPASRSCVTWESTVPAIYGVFVPVSNAVTSISEPYNANQSAGGKGTFDTERYPYYAFKALCTLCVEPNCCKTYGSPVRDYWNNAAVV